MMSQSARNNNTAYNTTSSSRALHSFIPGISARENAVIRWAKTLSAVVSVCMVCTAVYVYVLYPSFSRSSDSAGGTDKPAEPGSGSKLILAAAAGILKCHPGVDAMRRTVDSETGARCIDGSKPAYYIRRVAQGSQGYSKWMIHFEGGGWPYTLDEAYQRSLTDLGSSKKYPACLKDRFLKFTESSDAARNPTMFGWNSVHVKYCDGGSYAGDAVVDYKSGKKLHFKGKAIRDAVIRQLLDNEGMAEATEVVISGCSAGGLAVYFGIDAMAQTIANRNSSVRVRALSDSGFFEVHPKVKHYQIRRYGDRENAVIDGHLNYAGAMRHIFGLMNISAGVHPACLQERQAKGEAVDNCVFAAANAKHITTPFFALQPKFDRWQLWHVMGQPFDVTLVNGFGNSMFKSVLETLLNKPQHGAFFDACAHHCMSCSSSDEDPWNGDNIKSTSSAAVTPAKAFAQWYQDSLQVGSNDKEGDGKYTQVESFKLPAHLYYQNHSYPCDRCCICVP